MTNAERREEIQQLFDRAQSLTRRARIRADSAEAHLIDAAHELRSVMKTIDELNTALEELKEKVRLDEEQDDANETALRAVIADLQQQVDSGTTDFTAQIDKLNEIAGMLHGSASQPTDTTEPGTGTING